MKITDIFFNNIDVIALPEGELTYIPYNEKELAEIENGTKSYDSLMWSPTYRRFFENESQTGFVCLPYTFICSRIEDLNTLASRSNHEVLMELYEEFLIEREGELFISTNTECSYRLSTDITALLTEGIIDDDHLMDLKEEIETENWEEDGIVEFVEYIEESFPNLKWVLKELNSRDMRVFYRDLGGIIDVDYFCLPKTPDSFIKEDFLLRLEQCGMVLSTDYYWCEKCGRLMPVEDCSYTGNQLVLFGEPSEFSCPACNSPVQKLDKTNTRQLEKGGRDA